jgi:hypothetical protein
MKESSGDDVAFPSRDHASCDAQNTSRARISDPRSQDAVWPSTNATGAARAYNSTRASGLGSAWSLDGRFVSSGGPSPKSDARVETLFASSLPAPCPSIPHRTYKYRTFCHLARGLPRALPTLPRFRPRCREGEVLTPSGFIAN